MSHIGSSDYNQASKVIDLKLLLGEKMMDAVWKILAFQRFFLATIVVFFHLRYKDGVPLNFLSSFDGHAAVIGFLFISGFSIAASITRNRNQFYRRRLLRIYPLLALSVLVTQLLATISPDNIIKTGWKTAICNLVLPNGIICAAPSFNPPLWSLGAEIIFYLLSPLLFTLNPIFLWTMIFVSAYAYVFVDNAGWILYGIPALRIMWPWLLGFLFYRSRSFLVKIFMYAGLVLIYFHGIPIMPYAYVTYLSTVVVLTTMPKFKIPEFAGRVMLYLGDISFPLYLFHFPIISFAHDVLKLEAAGPVIISIVVVTLCAHHLYDLKIKWLLSRF